MSVGPSSFRRRTARNARAGSCWRPWLERSSFMSRRASRSSALALLLLLAACQSGSSAPRSVDPDADVVIPYAVSGGGEVRFTVHPRYAVGDPVTFTLDIRAGTLRVRGPLSGRVLASELESGEQLIRTLGSAGLGGV